MLFFFFSSRRRHTRLQGDWSSDVCSSDLLLHELVELPPSRRRTLGEQLHRELVQELLDAPQHVELPNLLRNHIVPLLGVRTRLDACCHVIRPSSFRAKRSLGTRRRRRRFASTCPCTKENAKTGKTAMRTAHLFRAPIRRGGFVVKSCGRVV